MSEHFYMKSFEEVSSYTSAFAKRSQIEEEERLYYQVLILYKGRAIMCYY